MKVALVLGGGGARGMAHVGVLKALEREKINIDLIVGCSSGAIVGGMYAQTPHADLVEKRLRIFVDSTEFEDLGLGILERRATPSDDYLGQLVRTVRDRVLLNIFAGRISILRGERFERVIHFLIKKGTIEQVRIPFACNATDLISGLPILFTRGDIRTAILASSSIPGYLPPVEVDGRKLIDGAVTYNLPIKFAQALGAKFVIGVDVHPIVRRDEEVRNFFDVILRASMITGAMLSEETAHNADFLIRPDVGGYYWYEFHKFDELMKAGEEAVYSQIETLREMIPTKRKSPLRRLLRLEEKSEDRA